jgi:hypothetical protein
VILGGYFPKLVVPRPKWLAEPRVSEVCSVSNCVSAGPEDWTYRWIHNSLGWFNTLADAWSVVPPGDVERYRMFAYRLAPSFYRRGTAERLLVPEDVRPEPLPAELDSLGFDTYSKSMDSILGPECSPLSCNGLAPEFQTNPHCLLDTLDEACKAASRFSLEQPEPGDYYVAEVLQQRQEDRGPGATAR